MDIVFDIVPDMRIYSIPVAGSMEKASRPSLAGKSWERFNGGFHSQGAPRGLLHFYALLSIARKPLRGYDLIKEIEAKTEGAWRPGPGAVYPTLQRLTKQGLIAAKRKTRDGPKHVIYEITPAGLRNIANAKKVMNSSTERMALMSSLFIDLMEPDDLVRFILNSFDMQTELLHMITESDRSGLSSQDKLFVLRQHRLNLERELARAAVSIKKIDSQTRSQNDVVEGGR
jgi:DNA-binding PadR family transcriptional regulator